jgi:hypothetical protein
MVEVTAVDVGKYKTFPTSLMILPTIGINNQFKSKVSINVASRAIHNIFSTVLG